MGYEALVRGVNQEPTWEILSKVNVNNRYSFDQNCRVKALETASKLGLDACLSINFMPNAIYNSGNCIRTTLAVASKYNFNPNQIIFEMTEAEKVEKPAYLTNMAQYQKSLGFHTTIDNFGAGYADLSLLANFQPEFVKIDIKCLENIYRNKPK